MNVTLVSTLVAYGGTSSLEGIYTFSKLTILTIFAPVRLCRAEKKCLQILLSVTQSGPGRKVKQEQEEISRNHIPRLFLSSV